MFSFGCFAFCINQLIFDYWLGRSVSKMAYMYNVRRRTLGLITVQLLRSVSSSDEMYNQVVCMTQTTDNFCLLFTVSSQLMM